METYYAYLRWCRDYNESNLIDPTSEKMEWHHTLPQCIFGDIRIGLWLTLKQHAIATALQTLAFNHNCLCGWHLSYLPPTLLTLVYDLFVKANRKAASYSGYSHSTDGARTRAREINQAFHSVKDCDGRSVHALNTLHREEDGVTPASKGGIKGGRKTGRMPWWVNPKGETTRSLTSPGPTWVLGRVYK